MKELRIVLHRVRVPNSELGLGTNSETKSDSELRDSNKEYDPHPLGKSSPDSKSAEDDTPNEFGSENSKEDIREDKDQDEGTESDEDFFAFVDEIRNWKK